MKNLILIIFFLLAKNVAFSQKMITRSGEIKFEASMPAFEEVAAKNNTVSCILNASNGDLAALALVKAFKFKVPLMEEHFNENYVESSKFPKATFKGKILNFDASKVSGAKSGFDFEGDLTLHGITKKIKSKVFLNSNAGKWNLMSSFSVKVSDFDIKIPSLVKSKVAEDVKVSLNFVLVAK